MQVCSPVEVGVSDSQLKNVSLHLQSLVDAGEISGCQLLLSRRDQVCHFSSHGWHSIENQKKIKEDTIFRIYSMTKPIVSVAVMMLYEEGLLQIQDPVSRYLPQFADLQVYVDEHAVQEPQRPVLIRDLLSHTSGLTYGFMNQHPVEQKYQEMGLPGHESSNQEFIEALCSLPLLFHPGTDWRYSVAVDVLGVLVATIAETTLGEFLSERIFQPLDMEDTDFVVPTSKRDRLLTCYQKDESGTLTPALHLTAEHDPFIRETFESGGGGLASTSADYLQFCRMLLHKGVLDGNRYLGRKTVEYMATNHLDSSILPFTLGESNFAGYGFGLGFRILMDTVPLMRLGGLGSFGWAGAADTFFWIDPSEEMIGIYMGQHMPSGPHLGARTFQSLAYAALID